MTGVIKFLPCPFCGGQNIEICINMAGRYFCTCRDCSSTGSDLADSRAAVDAWNKRTTSISIGNPPMLSVPATPVSLAPKVSPFPEIVALKETINNLIEENQNLRRIIAKIQKTIKKGLESE